MSGSMSGSITPVLTPASRLKVGLRKQVKRSDQCWEVTEADLDMYGMIVGRAPSDSEKVEALLKARRRQELADQRAAEDLQRRPPASGWSPMVLCDYLRGICNGAIEFRFGGPMISAWVRNLSIQARQRLQETQARLTSARAR